MQRRPIRQQGVEGKSFLGFNAGGLCLSGGCLGGTGRALGGGITTGRNLAQDNPGGGAGLLYRDGAPVAQLGMVAFSGEETGFGMRELYKA